ncbi:hypothetical protein SAMN05443633_101141 [Chryseobacterium arachidis]|uniref:CarboxypepD_reg-like domain-containing protein n=1 Tax=Chryseobacterium arachidis TaxID=1416778 RepID=A0A1M4T2X1_9FLAO|nr:hypothetical protein [Chryseobacterium arachidis]SHE38795.1 hypothetical protein SAMN05443633_101141 [Chryseobacterium arachidis]
MKLYFLNATFIFFLISCVATPDYYEGYIFTKEKKPLPNIKVCEINKNNCTITDNKGFFKMKKTKSSINDLAISYKNKPLDTIKTVWSNHGERISYSFVEGKKDTIFIDL